MFLLQDGEVTKSISTLEDMGSHYRCSKCGSILRKDRKSCPVCSLVFKPIPKEVLEKNEKLVNEQRQRAERKRTEREAAGKPIGELRSTSKFGDGFTKLVKQL